MNVAWAVNLLVAAATAAGPTEVKTYPEGADGLKALVSDLGALSDGEAYALAEDLVLEDPAAWFKSHFADTAEVAALVEEYEKAAQPGGLNPALYARNNSEYSDLVVERFEGATDTNAVGYQELAFEAAQGPLVLYSVRAVRADKRRTVIWHLYNFVYVGQAWKWVGPMKALGARRRKPGQDVPADLKLDVALGLRVKERDAFLRTNKPPR